MGLSGGYIRMLSLKFGSISYQMVSIYSKLRYYRYRLGTVPLDLNFTNARAQKVTARNIHSNAPKQFARAREFFSSAHITNTRNACRKKLHAIFIAVLPSSLLAAREFFPVHAL